MFRLGLDWLYLVIGVIIAIPVGIIIWVLIAAFVILYPLNVMLQYSDYKELPEPMVDLEKIYKWSRHV